MAMNFRTFSHKDKLDIKELLESHDYSDELTPLNKLRYSIIKDSYLALTAKIPISIGVKLNIPFESGAIFCSFLLRPRIINSRTLEEIEFLAINLPHIIENITLEQTYPIEQKKRELVDILNDIMPESMNKENESQWISRVRVSVFNKYNKLIGDKEGSFNSSIVNALGNLGLKPTWERPIWLQKGLPRPRLNSTLFFTNDENNEFFILEKGYISFYREFTAQNVLTRVSIESYSPMILEKLFSDIEGFSTIETLMSWIKYSRTLLMGLSSVLDPEYVSAIEYLDFKLVSIPKSDIETSAFPIPALVREIYTKSDLLVPNKELFSYPPSKFEEMEAIGLYSQALKIIKAGKFKDAVGLLNRTLVILTRNRQHSGMILCLIKLAYIGNIYREHQKAAGYLNSALEIAKEGDVPAELILKVHNSLGDSYKKYGNYGMARRHFGILIQFLSAEDKEINKKRIIDAKLHIAEVLILERMFKDAMLILKEIAKDMIKSPEIIIKYQLALGDYHYAKQSISNAVANYKKACLFEDAPKHLMGLSHYKLGRLYLYERNMPKRAQGHLLVADKLIGEKEVEDLRLKIKVYEACADSFSRTKEREEMKFYMDRARQIQHVLQIRGLL